jgi:hypothetical protein
VSRVGALVAVVLVVLEAATSVVVNWVTDGLSPWLWLALGGLVVATCALVWRQSRRTPSPNSTRVRVRAGTGAVVEDSPVEVPGRGQVEVSTTASWWGRVRRSGTTVRR